MRYTIGCKIVERDGTITEGLYALYEYGMCGVLAYNNKNFEDNTHRILVFSDIEEAKKYIKFLSNSYRKEFHERAKRYNFDINNFKFFLLKVDSSKMKDYSLQEYKKSNKYKSLIYYYINMFKK